MDDPIAGRGHLRATGVARGGLDRLEGSRVSLALLPWVPLGVALVVALLTAPPAMSDVTGDLRVYGDDSAGLLGGLIPYRGFALEYPPLALLPMTLPRLAWPFATLGDDAYQWLFALMEGTIAVGTGWLVARLSGGSVRAVTMWALLAIAAGASITWRYDLWPATLVLVAVAAADRGRPGLAGLAIGAGTMLKLFPIVVLPILVLRALALRDRRGLVRLLLGFAVAIGAVMGAVFAIAGSDSFGWIAYELDRGLSIESTGSGVLLLLHIIAGQPYQVAIGFGTIQVVAPGADLLVAATPVVEACLVGAVSLLAFVRFRGEAARMGRVPFASLVAASAAVLVALIVSSKVFSVQYVVWFLPLVPFLSGRIRWLALAVAGISSLIYPLNYFGLWTLDPVLAVLLNVRNLLLVVLLAWLAVMLRPLPAAPSTARRPVRGPGAASA